MDFLRDSVISKLQIPLNKLIEIKKHYKDTLLNEKVINPLLKSAIHEASLEDLLLARFNFKSELAKLDQQLIELTDTYIREKIQQISFDNLKQLIEIKSNHQHPIIDEHFKNLLRNNVSSVVDRFIKSSAYASAAGNASLLIEIIEYFNPKQWEYILEAFCNNDQIYCSFNCPDIFISLFKKSVEISGSVEPYWLSFREKLDGFNNNYKDINRLKQIIDSSQKTV